jgi:hypothetical protein
MQQRRWRFRKVMVAVIFILLAAACRRGEALPTGVPSRPAVTLTPFAEATTLPTFPVSGALPTLSASEELAVIGLLYDNSGCKLPCLWGITPGTTSEREALAILSPVSALVAGRPSTIVSRQGHEYETHGVVAKYTLHAGTQWGQIELTITEGIVELIRVQPVGTQVSYSAAGLFAELGLPNRTLVYIDPDTDQFMLIGYFPMAGVVASYEGYAYGAQGSALMCLGGIAPGLWLWSPGRLLAVGNESEIGPDLRFVQPKLLSEVTGLGGDALISLLTGRNPPCILVESVW